MLCVKFSSTSKTSFELVPQPLISKSTPPWFLLLFFKEYLIPLLDWTQGYIPSYFYSSHISHHGRGTFSNSWCSYYWKINSWITTLKVDIFTHAPFTRQNSPPGSYINPRQRETTHPPQSVFLNSIPPLKNGVEGWDLYNGVFILN